MQLPHEIQVCYELTLGLFQLNCQGLPKGIGNFWELQFHAEAEQILLEISSRFSQNDNF